MKIRSQTQTTSLSETVTNPHISLNFGNWSKLTIQNSTIITSKRWTYSCNPKNCWKPTKKKTRKFQPTWYFKYIASIMEFSKQIKKFSSPNDSLHHPVVHFTPKVHPQKVHPINADTSGPAKNFTALSSLWRGHQTSGKTWLIYDILIGSMGGLYI